MLRTTLLACLVLTVSSAAHAEEFPQYACKPIGKKLTGEFAREVAGKLDRLNTTHRYSVLWNDYFNSAKWFCEKSKGELVNKRKKPQ